MNIDYSKIVPQNLTLFINERDLESLKIIGRKERNKIKNSHNSALLKELFAKRADEIVYLKHEYQGYSSVEKAIILANIVFDNDQKIAYILSTGNFEKETLETYLQLLSYLKIKSANQGLDENDKKYNKTVNDYAKKLVNHIAKYVGPVTPEIIINKINEIISFNPKLLDTKESQQTR